MFAYLGQNEPQFLRYSSIINSEDAGFWRASMLSAIWERLPACSMFLGQLSSAFYCANLCGVTRHSDG